MTNDWRDWKPNVNEKVDEEKLIGRKFIYFSIFFILIIIFYHYLDFCYFTIKHI